VLQPPLCDDAEQVPGGHGVPLCHARLERPVALAIERRNLAAARQQQDLGFAVRGVGQDIGAGVKTVGRRVFVAVERRLGSPDMGDAVRAPLDLAHLLSIAHLRRAARQLLVTAAPELGERGRRHDGFHGCRADIDPAWRDKPGKTDGGSSKYVCDCFVRLVAE